MHRVLGAVFLFALAVLLFSASAQEVQTALPGPGRWYSARPLPVALGEVAGGFINGYMYLVGEGSTSTLVYSYFHDTWANRYKFAVRPYPGNHHAAEVINNRLYLFGGLENGSPGKVQIYDPAANVWRLGASMPFATGAASSAYINGKAIVVGGIVNGTTVNYAASYDPVANRWTWVAPMLHGVNHAASTTDGTRLWVFGGRGGGNTVSNGYNYVQVYTPSTNSWRWSSPLPQARGGMGKAVYYQGEFYIFGGETYNGAGATALHVYDRVDIYNPATNTWRRGTAMPTPRHGIFPLLFWGHIFIAGGGIHSYYSTSTANDVYVP